MSRVLHAILVIGLALLLSIVFFAKPFVRIYQTLHQPQIEYEVVADGEIVNIRAVEHYDGEYELTDAYHVKIAGESKTFCVRSISSWDEEQGKGNLPHKLEIGDYVKVVKIPGIGVGKIIHFVTSKNPEQAELSAIVKKARMGLLELMGWIWLLCAALYFWTFPKD